MMAALDERDPVFAELLRLMREHGLNDLGVLGAMFEIAYEQNPNGPAIEYICDGGGDFAAIATRLGWSHDQLLAAIVAHLQKTNDGSPSPTARLH